MAKKLGGRFAKTGTIVLLFVVPGTCIRDALLSAKLNARACQPEIDQSLGDRTSALSFPQGPANSRRSPA